MLFRYNTPETVRENSLQYLPSLFARHRLKLNTRVRVDRAWGLRIGEEPTAREYFINEHGYRGQSFSLRKKVGIRRMVVLGGSSVFDVNATEGMDWPHLLEPRLRDRGIGNVEIMNAGVPGHATFDSLGRLYSQVWTLEPDYVVLYHGWNDIKYWTILDDERSLMTEFGPYDSMADPFQNYLNPVDRLLSMSQVYVKLRNAYFVRTSDVGLEGKLPDDKLYQQWGAAGVSQFKLNLQLLVDAARNIGAVPVLATEATLVSATNSADDRARIQYRYVQMTHDGLVRAFEIAHETVRLVASEKHVPLVDVAKSLSGRSELFADHVHTNARGSEAIAKVIADSLAVELVSRVDRKEMSPFLLTER